MCISELECSPLQCSWLAAAQLWTDRSWLLHQASLGHLQVSARPTVASVVPARYNKCSAGILKIFQNICRKYFIIFSKNISKHLQKILQNIFKKYCFILFAVIFLNELLVQGNKRFETTTKEWKCWYLIFDIQDMNRSWSGRKHFIILTSTICVPEVFSLSWCMTIQIGKLKPGFTAP